MNQHEPCRHGRFIWLDDGYHERLLNPACVEHISLRYDDSMSEWIALLAMTGSDVGTTFKFESEAAARKFVSLIVGDEDT